MTATLERISRNKCFGGYQDVYRHESSSLGCTMRFAAYLPETYATRAPPILYYLSGLTCTEQNVVTKAGAQRHCAEHQLLWICPDTSPRGESIPDDPASDLGQGASFYVNATEGPWARNYRMFDYLTVELPKLVSDHLSDSPASGIFGHSMGGHGALMLALRRPDQYRSISAFSPVCAPSQCPWGQKAFAAYLGRDREAWKRYDSVELLATHSGPPLEMLVDQGLEDPFLTEQLMPELLEQAAARGNHSLTLRRQAGYDHSYYFIASFIEDHIRHHAERLHG